jgi:hypothetical protein
MKSKTTSSLLLTGFTPTKFNYTDDHTDPCLVCHNYDEIDALAKAVALPKLQSLCNAFAGGYPKSLPGQFDATALLNAVKDIIRPPSGIVSETLEKQTWCKQDSNPSLSKIFSLYVGYPVKNKVDMDAIEKASRERMGALIKEAISRGDKSTVTEYSAKLESQHNQLAAKGALFDWVDGLVRESLVDSLARELWNVFQDAKIKTAKFAAGDGDQIDYVARARLLHV